MPVPWLRIIDTVLGVTDLARTRAPRAQSAATEQLAPGSGALGHLETRLAGVVVAALREAFDRDSRRLELEREHMEAERQRAERALKLELLRQSADREIGRLRLIAAVAVATWVGALFLSTRVIGGPVGARITLGAGGALLLGALAAAFVAQSRVANSLTRLTDLNARQDDLANGVGGAVAPWLLIGGLALVGTAMFIG
jgi:hypothetical protein